MTVVPSGEALLSEKRAGRNVRERPQEGQEVPSISQVRPGAELREPVNQQWLGCPVLPEEVDDLDVSSE